MTNYYSFYSVFLIFLILLLTLQGQKKTAAAARHIRKTKKETELMEELARRFIGKECIIYTITSNSGDIQGTIKEVTGSGMLIENQRGEQQAINLEYITRIREYPRNKNGKKKSIVV